MTATIVLGADHAGFALEQICLEHLRQLGLPSEDLGTDSAAVSCDYPWFAAKVAERVLAGDGLGLLICGSGLGMSMVANRFSGIRAALCGNEFSARVSRQHNNANVLCLGARVTGQDLALSVLDTFLNTDFEGGRHQRRLDLFEK